MDCKDVAKFFDEEKPYSFTIDDVLRHIADCPNPLCMDIKKGMAEIFEAVVWEKRGEKEQAKAVFSEGVKKIDTAINLYKLESVPSVLF